MERRVRSIGSYPLFVPGNCPGPWPCPYSKKGYLCDCINCRMMSKHIVKAAAFTGIALGFALGLSSCNTSPNALYNKKYQSPSTGWMVNDPKWGGFQNNDHYQQPVPSRFQFVQGGFFTMGMNQEDLKFEHNNAPHPVTVSSFYMDEVETSNADYNEYIYWLDRVYGTDHPEVVERAQPDPLVWNSIGGFRDQMTENYFESPGYNNYPVVGVTWEQARDYCEWRTDRYNEYILLDAKLMSFNPDQKNDDNFNTAAYLERLYVLQNEGVKDMSMGAEEDTKRPVEKRDGILMEKLRLPTEAEWEYAALALIGNSEQERLSERRVYPWNGKPLQVRSSDKKYRGKMMGNFSRGQGDYMGSAGALNDGADYTAPVYSYFPNDFGLYNMAGNVAEWCMDVYRPLSYEDADALNAFRGNVYMTVVRDEDGTVAEKDSLGRVPYRLYTDEELADRDNFQRADNRNFADGDGSSSLNSEFWGEGLEEGSESEMAQVSGPGDYTNSLYEYGTSSLISDKSRVVKGGSWKDRAYYMSPAIRRYLDQDRSAAWIGFRCVMSRVGSSEDGATNIRRIGSRGL